MSEYHGYTILDTIAVSDEAHAVAIVKETLPYAIESGAVNFREMTQDYLIGRLGERRFWIACNSKFDHQTNEMIKDNWRVQIINDRGRWNYYDGFYYFSDLNLATELRLMFS